MKQTIPLIIVIACVVFVGISALTGKNKADDAAANETAVVVDVSAVAAADEEAGQEADVSAEGEQAAVEKTDTVADGSVKEYHAVAAKEAIVSEIGSNDPGSGYKLKVELSGWGASIYKVWLTDYQVSTTNDEPYLVQSYQEVVNQDKSKTALFPFAAYQVRINGETVSLSNVRWENTGAGKYAITIADRDDKPVLRITRTYSVEPGDAAYDITCRQTLDNLTEETLTVVWDQFAQGDLVSKGAYEKLRDQRSYIAGYYDTGYDPQRLRISTEHTFKRRSELLKKWYARKNETDHAVGFWPNDDLPAQRELAWLASTNRYFAAATHRVMPDASTTPSPTYAPRLDEMFPNIRQVVLGYETEDQGDMRHMMLRLMTDPIEIKANGSKSLNVAMFAGPRSVELFKQYPYKAMDFKNIIKYDLGCTWCTFQPLARFLLGFLKVIHVITFDWGIAIIVLVLVVRLILHPLTKKSQVNMMKMSKAMQSLAPELEKLKIKYKNDQQTLNRETMALYREKGVNPANFLGCLPMLLQMPIWVALYAMLYFAIELRGEPAFYGIFQAISGGNWEFLADLSNPDRFIRFTNEPFMLNYPLLNTLDFSSLNILPILMGIMYFLQQQLMSPPAANEQAAQQQKMMKFMMLLFPVFLYSAPSGLTLYILASSSAGIIDSYIVRKHVKQMEEDGTLFDKKQPKTGGFFDRMSKFAERQQRAMDDRQKQLEKPGKTKNRKKR